MSDVLSLGAQIVANGTVFVINARPVSIPLSEKDPVRRERNEAVLTFFTGKTPSEIKACAAEADPVTRRRLKLRRRGTGSGTRFELYLADWDEYVSSLPTD